MRRLHTKTPTGRTGLLIFLTVVSGLLIVLGRYLQGGLGIEPPAQLFWSGWVLQISGTVGLVLCLLGALVLLLIYGLKRLQHGVKKRT